MVKMRRRTTELKNQQRSSFIMDCKKGIQSCRADRNRAASGVQFRGGSEKEKTYSLCIALTTALEKGAELVVALIANDRLRVDRNMQTDSRRKLHQIDEPRISRARPAPAQTPPITSSPSWVSNSRPQHGPPYVIRSEDIRSERLVIYCFPWTPATNSTNSLTA
jgi:hypothetical protein